MRSPTIPASNILRSVGLAIGVMCVTASASAQETGAEPLYGTANLDAGFLPDPHVVEIISGGPDAANHLRDDCLGYISNEQPDYDLNYEAGSSRLGIFVSGDTDTTLVVNDPRGNWHCNDDSAHLNGGNPGILFDTPLSGNYNIWIGTYEDVSVGGEVSLAITELNEDSWASMILDPVETGDGNSVAVGGSDFGDDVSTWANNDECDDPRFQGRNMAQILIDSDMFHDASDCSALFASGDIRLVGGANLILGSRIERGALASGDNRRDNDAYADSYTFTANRGDNAVINLRSGNFDTYLIVRSPSGEEFINDDFESSFDRSLLSMSLTETGIYEVVVSSYDSGESGGYTVEIQTDSDGARFDNQQFNGTLASGDDTYDSGEYVDSYSFEGRPGQQLSISLNSDSFDTYLILRGPNGESEVNDDAENTASSLIETELSELGTYEVFVTSYASEETGDYSLIIRENSGTSAAGQDTTSRDVIAISLGENLTGNLQAGDRRSDENKYQDSYVFSAQAGDAIILEMNSTAVDTYLSLLTPSGESIENDDYQGSTDRSRLEITLQESGRYRVIASSYGSDETGSYLLTLNTGSVSSVSTAATQLPRLAARSTVSSPASPIIPARTTTWH